MDKKRKYVTHTSRQQNTFIEGCALASALKNCDIDWLDVPHRSRSINAMCINAIIHSTVSQTISSISALQTLFFEVGNSPKGLYFSIIALPSE